MVIYKAYKFGIYPNELQRMLTEKNERKQKYEEQLN